jgi:hypothetical protein
MHLSRQEAIDELIKRERVQCPDLLRGGCGRDARDVHDAAGVLLLMLGML